MSSSISITDKQIRYIADYIQEEESRAAEKDQLPIDLEEVIAEAIEVIKGGVLDHANV